MDLKHTHHKLKYSVDLRVFRLLSLRMIIENHELIGKVYWNM